MSYGDFIGQRGRQPTVRFSCSCDADNFGLCSNNITQLQQRALPLHELMFCSECAKLICERCADASIDSYYCGSCMKSYFSSTAAENKNRCESCVECPSCFHTLSTQVNSTTKQYSLLCEFCQWNSDEAIGLAAPDPVSLLGKVKAVEMGVESEQKFTALLGTYKQRYKQSKDKNPPSSRFDTKKAPHKRSSIQLHDFQRACAMLDAELLKQQASQNKLPASAVSVEQAQADARFQAQVGQKPDGSKLSFDLENVTSLQQRLSHPALQPFFTKQLYPRRKNLSTKLAYRCRACLKYAIKPKAGANVVYFDLQSLALSYLPTMTVCEVAPLEKNKPCRMLLYFRNPVQTELTMQLRDLPLVDDQQLAKIHQGSIMKSLQPSLDGTSQGKHQRRHSRQQSYYGVLPVPASPMAGSEKRGSMTSLGGDGEEKLTILKSPPSPSTKTEKEQKEAKTPSSGTTRRGSRDAGTGVSFDDQPEVWVKPSKEVVAQIVSGPVKLVLSAEEFDALLESKKQFKTLLPPVSRAVVADKKDSKSDSKLETKTDGKVPLLKASIPQSDILLSAFDEIAMHGEIFLDKGELEAQKKKDDPNAIGFRYLNKVGVITELTPMTDPQGGITMSLLVNLSGGEKANNGFTEISFAAHIHFTK